MPKISVIVPIYNTESYLKECLDSIINQTLLDIEIILINDGSTDNSSIIMKEFKEKDSRIIIINQKNQGQGEARNVGIKLAKAPYLAFVDSDDIIHPKMLEKLYSKILLDNSDIVKCTYTRELNNFFTNENYKTINFNTKDKYFKEILSINYLSLIWDGLYKKNLFTKNHLFFKNMVYEDAELLFKLVYNSKKLSYIQDTLYFWRETNNSTSRSINKKQIDDIFKVIRITYNFLEKENIYIKYKIEFLQRCFYYQNRILDKINGYGKDKKEIYIKYLDKKISKYKFFNKKYLNLIRKYDFPLYINCIMKKAFMYLEFDKELFKSSIKPFSKNISQIGAKKNTYILYGNGTISKIIQNLIPNKIIGYVDISDKDYHPSTLKNIVFDKIIVTVAGREKEIINYLVTDLKVNKNKILTLEEIIN